MTLQAQALQILPVIRASLAEGEDVIDLVPLSHAAFQPAPGTQGVLRKERRAQLCQVAPAQSLATTRAAIELAHHRHRRRVGEQRVSDGWNETRQATLRDIAFVGRACFRV